MRWSLNLAALLLAWCACALAQVQEAPPAPRFDIARFNVVGNTLLPQPQVDAIVAPFAGKSRDFGDVQRALEALQDAYVERGFTAVRVVIPEQDLHGGEVRLQVIEARLRNVTVEGNKFFGESNVRAALPALKAGEAPNTKRIGENVQLSNENPAKQVNVVLQATDVPGQADAVVRVTDYKPTRYTLSLDNTGTPQTGNLRLGFGFQHANVADRDQVLTAQFITSPTNVNNVKIYGAGYHAPVYSWGGSVDVFAGYSDVNSGTVGDLFTVSGKGTILGARYNHILPRFGAYEQKLGFGLDYRDFHQNVALVGTNTTLVPDITIKPWSISYSGRLSQVGNDLAFLASFSQNLPGGSDGGATAFQAQRVNAPSRYKIWRAAGVWSYALPQDYLLRLAANLQYTDDPLVIGEQFGMGGQDSVRGFYEREVSNDNGYRLSTEVYGPDLGQHLGADWRARALGFIDLAHGRDVAPVRSNQEGLSSIGLGLRLNQGRSLSLRADWAIVTNASAGRPNNHDRFHFAIAYSF